MAKIRDLTGARFGRLTVIECSGRDKHGNALWLCKCDCGKETKVIMQSLKDGRTKSCGCLKEEKSREGYIKHGGRNTRLYTIWCGLKDRCYRQSNKKFANYGGRGITVCPEWLNDFQAFYDWAMANGYADNLSIDRIDNDGNYEPSNCRWATQKEQMNNTRKNNYFTYNGETKTLSEWSELLNIHYDTLYMRLNRGWTIEEAFTVPLIRRRNYAK